MVTGNLYVVPIINTMGPVSDTRHNDLLTNWKQIDHSLEKIFDESYRNQIPDSQGNPMIFSWFFVSWSGFKINPVNRDFGWFTIYDHYIETFGKKMSQFNDGMYWMYNHPPPSGIGNEWGLDWTDNFHYFDIMNRFLLERNYFPSVIQIPTEKNNESNWIENWFPFDFSNRNVDELDTSASQEQGKTISDVLDWKNAPSDWSEYHPSSQDYRKKGNLNRTVFRLLDIKSRIYSITENEIEKAFLRCKEGKDTIISAYEHDFRDRSQTILNNFIEPINELSQKHDVKWFYSNALTAAQSLVGCSNYSKPVFEIKISTDSVNKNNFVLIKSSKELFGTMPYVVTKNLETYEHHPVSKIGYNLWKIDRSLLPERCVLGISSSDKFGNVGINKFNLENNIITKAK